MRDMQSRFRLDCNGTFRAVFSRSKRLLLIVALAGDFDFNGEVNGLDFLLWQRDPTIGSLADWEANYGATAPLTASSAAVPEPSALLFAALAAVGRRIA
jgi:hypothetical protein